MYLGFIIMVILLGNKEINTTKCIGTRPVISLLLFYSIEVQVHKQITGTLRQVTLNLDQHIMQTLGIEAIREVHGRVIMLALGIPMHQRHIAVNII